MDFSTKWVNLPPGPSLKNLTDGGFGALGDRQHAAVQDLTKAHIESFNQAVTEGLARVVQAIPPLEFMFKQDKVTLTFVEATIHKPVVTKGSVCSEMKVYPAECRGRRCSYKGKLVADISWAINGVPKGIIKQSLGHLPIMVKSKLCNLHGLSPKELVKHHEEAEVGFSFTLNPHLLPRRRTVAAHCSPRDGLRCKRISMHCVREEHSAINMNLHYLENGTVMLNFIYQKELFFIPLGFALRALVDFTDFQIYQELTKGREDNSFYKTCVSEMLRMVSEEGCTTRSKVLAYLGGRFRVKLTVPDWYTNEQCANFLLNECLCIHLRSDLEKFYLLCLMTRKLFTYAKQECMEENPDSLMCQEVLTPGQLYLMFLKEKLTTWLTSVKLSFDKRGSRLSGGWSPENVIKMLNMGSDLTKPFEYLLATGNLHSKTGLGMLQNTGLAVVADKLNFIRYLSHFRCVHRGAAFARMRTTSVRKLLPESWGFLCPVHTPDGAPCGLMNHMTASCEIITTTAYTTALPALLCSLGVTPVDGSPGQAFSDCFPVVLDGAVVGWVEADLAPTVVDSLRRFKVRELQDWNSRIEFKILLLTYKALNNQALSYIRALITPYVPNRALHSQTAGLLVVPRVSKEVSGVSRPAFCAPFRGNECRLFFLIYSSFSSRSGQIVNKSSWERGFAHGSIYKTELVDLAEKMRGEDSVVFGTKPGDPKVGDKLDADGLPHIGSVLRYGDPYYGYVNLNTGQSFVTFYKSQEACVVDNIKVCSNDTGSGRFKRVCITTRVPRNPTIGDKFASRHGQKGILSRLWPAEDMPFTESGMAPDILFNPHGFPSRMTIGMLIESMAGKSAALHGLSHDATPFTFSEENSALEYFGEMLRAGGYNYYGTERLYSGLSGQELEADIFIGVVYYQRLRHMVSDKFQVRTTGARDKVTNQPVGGRNIQGGIRFGEMERDALLAHGSSFLLQDRLFNCSDRSVAQVCVDCGSLLSPLLEKPPPAWSAMRHRRTACALCGKSDSIDSVSVPYVFRYFVAELAAMNIKVKLDVK
uniref:DNA-directed RNA polymerase subunit beta n=1 Tax=Fundulus heteroclitus TaxID=8078 RepID=A0A3Q2Q067_FUNHE